MSFSSKTKNDICLNIETRKPKKCCEVSLLYGILLNSGTLYSSKDFRTEHEKTAQVTRVLAEKYLKSEFVLTTGKTKTSLYKVEFSEEQKEKVAKIFGDNNTLNMRLFRCSKCKKYFVTGTFLSCGTAGSPEHNYHLEINMGRSDFSESFLTFLSDEGFNFKKSLRRGNNIFYIKESEKIEDFLYYIGAKSSAFELMNAKILKDLRNNLNRTSNFENANLEKTSSAAAYQISMIEKIIESGLFESLDDDLKETALLRKENEGLSLEEIAELSSKKISKSGINHRIKKLTAIAEELQNNSNE